jgi:hypothetical protein
MAAKTGLISLPLGRAELEGAGLPIDATGNDGGGCGAAG